MALEYDKNFNTGTMKCDAEKDGCHDSITLDGSYDSVVEQAKAMGWTSRKDSQDEWMNFCPGCTG